MNHKFLAITTMGLAFIFVSNSYAQEQFPFTLGKLWPKVEANYPGILAQTSIIEEAELKERAIRSAAIPQIKAQAQNTFGTVESVSGAFFPQSGLFNVNGVKLNTDNSNTTFNSYLSAVAEWNIYQFGRQNSENKAAELHAEKTVYDREVYILQLKKELAERYINLLNDNARLNWSTKNSQRLDDIRKLTAGLTVAGIKPAADSLLAYASFTQALAYANLWLGNKNASLIKLSELTGEEIIDYKASSTKFIHISARPNIQYSISLAHPLLKSLEKQRQYLEKNSKAEKKSSLPSIKAMGGYAFRSSGINDLGLVSNNWQNGFSNKSNNYLVGLGLTWNISSLYSKNLSALSLAKKADYTQHLQKQYEIELQSDISATEAKIKEQYIQLQQTDNAVKQAQNAYNMYLARYKSGLIALTELLQIQSLLEQAELTHIDAANQLWNQIASEAALTANFDFLFNNL